MVKETIQIPFKMSVTVLPTLIHSQINSDQPTKLIKIYSINQPQAKQGTKYGVITKNLL